MTYWKVFDVLGGRYVAGYNNQHKLFETEAGVKQFITKYSKRYEKLEVRKFELVQVK